MLRALEQPVHPFIQQDLEEEFSYRWGDMRISPDLAGAIYAARRAFLREALVGTYLKSLPDDGSAELDDGSAPTVK